MSATHYIHIGRNKCASTTLQHFFLNNAKVLRRDGLDYFVFGKMADAFPDARSFRTPADYAAHIASNTARPTLISSEDLMGPLCRTHAAPMLKALQGKPYRIIAYLRDYNEWTRSTYVEAAMTGRCTLDFDAYLRQTEFAISAMNALKMWARGGWENMHIRSLDRECLYKGDVLLDCAHAIDVKESIVEAHRPDPQHVSPHWMCVEIIRFLRSARTQIDWRSFTHGVIYPLRPLIEQAIAATGPHGLEAQYATPEQAARIHQLYNADVAELNKRTGGFIPSSQTPSVGTRSFLPTIDHVPLDVLQTLLAIAEEHFKTAPSPAYETLRKAFRWARKAKPIAPRTGAH